MALDSLGAEGLDVLFTFGKTFIQQQMGGMDFFCCGLQACEIGSDGALGDDAGRVSGRRSGRAFSTG